MSRYKLVKDGGLWVPVRRVEGGAVSDPTTAAWELHPSPDQGVWNAMQLRPLIVLPVALTSASKVIAEAPGLLLGWLLREAAASTAALAYLSASSANAAAANNVALAAQGAGITNFVTGFEITGTGATGQSTIAITLTGILGGTATYYIDIPAGVTAEITRLIVEFTSPGFPASGPNTAITLNVPSFGAGNAQASATIRGYAQAATVAPGSGQLAQAAQFDVFDGRDATGEILGSESLSAAAVSRQSFSGQGLLFRRGLFLSMVSGSVKGGVFARI